MAQCPHAEDRATRRRDRVESGTQTSSRVLCTSSSSDADGSARGPRTSETKSCCSSERSARTISSGSFFPRAHDRPSGEPAGRGTPRAGPTRTRSWSASAKAALAEYPSRAVADQKGVDKSRCREVPGNPFPFSDTRWARRGEDPRAMSTMREPSPPAAPYSDRALEPPELEDGPRALRCHGGLDRELLQPTPASQRPQLPDARRIRGLTLTTNPGRMPIRPAYQMRAPTSLAHLPPRPASAVGMVS